jgi:hypothetical protein
MSSNMLGICVLVQIVLRLLYFDSCVNYLTTLLQYRDFITSVYFILGKPIIV